MKKFDLEERLINFSVKIIEITDKMPKTKAGNHLAGQLIRSSTSAALNYGEAQSGESRRDFVHKIKVILKELRESMISLKILQKVKLLDDDSDVIRAIQENDEVISIFVKSADTAQKNFDRP